MLLCYVFYFLDIAGGEIVCKLAQILLVAFTCIATQAPLYGEIVEELIYELNHFRSSPMVESGP